MPTEPAIAKAKAATSLKLDGAMKERVQQIAAAKRRSPHWVMREAVEQYVEREERRERFHQEAVDAWTHYRDTGLHLTTEEADSWLTKLETGEEAPVPECHG